MFLIVEMAGGEVRQHEQAGPLLVRELWQNQAQQLQQLFCYWSKQIGI